MIGYVGYDETELETMLKDLKKKVALYYRRVSDRNYELEHDECEFITSDQQLEEKLLMEILNNINEALWTMPALKSTKKEGQKD